MRIATSAVVMLAVAGSLAAAQLAPYGRARSVSAPAQAVSQTPTPPVVASDYVIGPGDVLRVSVWQEPQFDETVEVRPDGRISLPLVSDVRVAGFTTEGAQNELTDRLQGFVKFPRVSVAVTEVRSKMVYVIGEVRHPGAFPLVNPINVSQLIAQAGGATPHARKKQVYVLRAGISKRYPVDYKKILQGKKASDDPLLAPGDTVVVP